MFLHVSVILSTGGQADTPRVDSPPGPAPPGPAPPGQADTPSRHPLAGRQPPWQADSPPPPQERPLQRTVRILLECILAEFVSG